jgi:hypothetical protein
VSWLSRQCGILNISLPYRSSRPVTGIVLISRLVSQRYISFLSLICALFFLLASFCLVFPPKYWKHFFSPVSATCPAYLVVLDIIIIIIFSKGAGIATGYGLNNRGGRVPVQVGSRIFISPHRPDRFWGPLSLLYNGYRGLFPRSKAVSSWSWSLTSKQCRNQEDVGLYINSLIRLDGVMLSQLSTGTITFTEH